MVRPAETGVFRKLRKILEPRRTARKQHGIERDLLPDALAVFDYSEASFVNGAREQTNVPAQALYLLNNDFVHTQAAKFVERLGAQTTPGTDQRLRHRIRTAAHDEGDANREVVSRSRVCQRQFLQQGLEHLLSRPLRQRRIPVFELIAMHARLSVAFDILRRKRRRRFGEVFLEELARGVSRDRTRIRLAVRLLDSKAPAVVRSSCSPHDSRVALQSQFYRITQCASFSSKTLRPYASRW